MVKLRHLIRVAASISCLLSGAGLAQADASPGATCEKAAALLSQVCDLCQKKPPNQETHSRVPHFGAALFYYRRTGGTDFLQYPGGTHGLLGEVSLPLSENGQGYYHLRVGNLHGDGFSGFMVVPLGLSWWPAVRPGSAWTLEPAFFLNPLAVEFMSGDRNAAHPTQSTLAVGWGAEFSLALAWRVARWLEVAAPVGIGVDRRYASFQAAGATRRGGGFLDGFSVVARVGLEFRPLRRLQ
jgi:hypothetical protein